MERGRPFYISLASGSVALALLLTSVNLPAQLVFETKPYALVVLQYGQLDEWSAEELWITRDQFNMVKENQAEFRSKHKLSADDSSESDDDDSDSESEAEDEDDNGEPIKLFAEFDWKRNRVIPALEDDSEEFDRLSNQKAYRTKPDFGSEDRKTDVDDEADDNYYDDEYGKTRSRGAQNGVDSDEADMVGEVDLPVQRPARTRLMKAVGGESSVSSSSEEGSSSESSMEITLGDKLMGKPLKQTIGLGLFHATICNFMKKTSKEKCSTVSDNEAISALKQVIPYMDNDINMPMWNNLRVESLFSIIVCVIGLVCILASLKPCCHHKRVPVYLGSLAFFASGVLVFIPIVRLVLVMHDFNHSLVSNMNVSTKLMTSWSLIASGIAVPFALVASFALIVTKWQKITQKFYKIIKSHPTDEEHTGNGSAVEIKMSDTLRHEIHPQFRPAPTNIYQNIEDKMELLGNKDKN